jgi:hypothetical protein
VQRKAELAARIGGLLLVAASGCSSSGSAVTLPGFSDVEQAPDVIQQAAMAVVRVGTSGSYATGSFISPDGVLLTNNHVLGIDVCPLEGCFVSLSVMMQRGQPPPMDQTVFAVPIAVDAGLDMAVVQTYTGPRGAKFSSPNFITLSSRDAASLVGTHVNVVGHPEGHLKKWSPGEIVDSNGAWISSTAFILPGNSGSPVLDDAGHLVGIMHRSPTSQDLGSDVGVDFFSLGTASAPLIAAMKAPLPATMWSIAAPATDGDVVSHQLLYLNARVANATVAGGSKQVLASLAAACDAGLAQTSFASPEELGTALSPCTNAEGWIECRSEEAANGFGVCPDDPSAWAARYQAVFDRWLAFNGQLQLDEITFADAALQSSDAKGTTTASSNLVNALARTNTPIDFDIADYLAAFAVTSYGGQSLVDYLNHYDRVPGYAIAGTSIAYAMLWLSNNGIVSGRDTESFLERLAADDRIDLGTKLYIEEVRYNSGTLH